MHLYFRVLAPLRAANVSQRTRHILSPFASCRRISTHDAHRILGVSPAASKLEVRASYLHLAKSLHPDTAAADPSNSDRSPDHTAMQELNLAYQMVLESVRLSPSRDNPVPRSTTRPPGPGPASRAAPNAAPGETGSRRESAFKPGPCPEGELTIRMLLTKTGEQAAVMEIMQGYLKTCNGAPHPKVIDAACSSLGPGQMQSAVELLKAAEEKGLTGPDKSKAVLSALQWCKEDDLEHTFELVSSIDTDDLDEDAHTMMWMALNTTFAYFPE